MAYAMARRRDLPSFLSKLHARHNTPYYSIWIMGLLMVFLVLLIDLKNVVAVGTFAMLFYYALANVSALRLKTEDKVYPRLVPALGAVTCVALLGMVLFISPQAWIIGLAGLVAGTVYYFVNRRASSRTTGSK
jgi:APA family basic amino acid/polyamine antiporter